jgi:hypothetical protein
LRVPESPFAARSITGPWSTRKKCALFEYLAGLPLKNPTLRGRIDGAEQTKN